MISIVLGVVGAALAGWLGYFAFKYLLPHVPNPVQARRDARARMVANPADHVRAWIVRVAPARLELQQNSQTAQTAAGFAAERETNLLKSFKEGKEPPFTYMVTVLTMFVLWLVAIIAAFLIDLPIIMAVSGGNFFFGLLGTILLLGLPIIGSVLLGHFFGRWRAGQIQPRLFAAIGTVIFVVFATTLGILMMLAPIRADIEYGEQIKTAEEQLVAYTEDGDTSAIALTERNLSDLQDQQARSAEWNTVLVPIAAIAEFVTGFFLPIAIPLLLYFDAKSSRRKADGKLTSARNAETTQRARQYRGLSAQFLGAGLTQEVLQQSLTAVNLENARDVAPPTPIQAARAQVAADLLAEATVGTPATQAADTITAEIVDTSELLVPRPRTSRVSARTSSSPAPAREDRRPTAQAPAEHLPPAAGDDLPDDSFDLS